MEHSRPGSSLLCPDRSASVTVAGAEGWVRSCPNARCRFCGPMRRSQRTPDIPASPWLLLAPTLITQGHRMIVLAHEHAPASVAAAALASRLSGTSQWWPRRAGALSESGVLLQATHPAAAQGARVSAGGSTTPAPASQIRRRELIAWRRHGGPHDSHLPPTGCSGGDGRALEPIRAVPRADQPSVPASFLRARLPHVALGHRSTRLSRG